MRIKLQIRSIRLSTGDSPGPNPPPGVLCMIPPPGKLQGLSSCPGIAQAQNSTAPKGRQARPKNGGWDLSGEPSMWFPHNRPWGSLINSLSPTATTISQANPLLGSGEEREKEEDMALSFSSFCKMGRRFTSPPSSWTSNPPPPETGVASDSGMSLLSSSTKLFSALLLPPHPLTLSLGHIFPTQKAVGIIEGLLGSETENGVLSKGSRPLT